MKKNQRLVASVVEIILGAVLTVCGIVGLVDSYWSGMGGGLLAVGAIQLVRLFRYRNNEQYREAVDVAVRDERNKYIAIKAWSWAGYLFVLIAAVGSIVLRIMHQNALSIMASGGVCLVLVLYWGSWLFLRKKY